MPRIKGGCMNILRRNAPETKAKSKEPLAEPAMSRRVKVTVERETVTLLVRGQPAKSEQEAASKTAEDQAGRLQLPSPAPAGEDKVKKRSKRF
jgi:hypothetical protein